MSSPEPEKPKVPPKKPGGSTHGGARASGTRSSSARGGGGAAPAKAPAIPDFGLSDHWEVVKLLGTGEAPGISQRRQPCGHHAAQAAACTRAAPSVLGGRCLAGGRVSGAHPLCI